MIGLGTDEFDLFAMDFGVGLEVDQVAIGPPALTTLKKAISHTPVAVTIGMGATPFPFLRWVGGYDSVHKLADNWYVNKASWTPE